MIDRRRPRRPRPPRRFDELYAAPPPGGTPFGPGGVHDLLWRERGTDRGYLLRYFPDHGGGDFGPVRVGEGAGLRPLRSAQWAGPRARAGWRDDGVTGAPTVADADLREMGAGGYLLLRQMLARLGARMTGVARQGPATLRGRRGAARVRPNPDAGVRTDWSPDEIAANLLRPPYRDMGRARAAAEALAGVDDPREGIEILEARGLLPPDPFGFPWIVSIAGDLAPEVRPNDALVAFASDVGGVLTAFALAREALQRARAFAPLHAPFRAVAVVGVTRAFAARLWTPYAHSTEPWAWGLGLASTLPHWGMGRALGGFGRNPARPLRAWWNRQPDAAAPPLAIVALAGLYDLAAAAGVREPRRAIDLATVPNPYPPLAQILGLGYVVERGPLGEEDEDALVLAVPLDDLPRVAP